MRVYIGENNRKGVYIKIENRRATYLNNNLEIISRKLTNIESPHLYLLLNNGRLTVDTQIIKYLAERLGLKEEIETMEGWREIQPSKEEVDVKEPKFRILSSPSDSLKIYQYTDPELREDWIGIETRIGSSFLYGCIVYYSRKEALERRIDNNAPQ